MADRSNIIHYINKSNKKIKLLASYKNNFLIIDTILKNLKNIYNLFNHIDIGDGNINNGENCSWLCKSVDHVISYIWNMFDIEYDCFPNINKIYDYIKNTLIPSCRNAPITNEYEYRIEDYNNAESAFMCYMNNLNIFTAYSDCSSVFYKILNILDNLHSYSKTFILHDAGNIGLIYEILKKIDGIVNILFIYLKFSIDLIVKILTVTNGVILSTYEDYSEYNKNKSSDNDENKTRDKMIQYSDSDNNDTLEKDVDECAYYIELYKDTINEMTYQYMLESYIMEDDTSQNSNPSSNDSNTNQQSGNQSSSGDKEQSSNDKQDANTNNQNNTSTNNSKTDDAKKQTIIQKIIEFINKLLEKVKNLFSKFTNKAKEVATANENAAFWNEHKDKIRTLDVSDVQVSDWYDYSYERITKNSVFVPFDAVDKNLETSEAFGTFILSKITGDSSIKFDGNEDFTEACKNAYVTKYFNLDTKVKFSGTDSSKYLNDLINLTNDYIEKGGAGNTILTESIVKDFNEFNKTSEQLKNSAFVEGEMRKLKDSMNNSGGGEAKQEGTVLPYDNYFTYLSEASKSRSKLSSSEFGLKEVRKYPLDSKKHVLSAVKFFNHVDPDSEEELANNIISKAKKFKLDLSNLVPEKSNNRLAKYLEKFKKNKAVESENESFSLADELGLVNLQEISVDTAGSKAEIAVGNDATEDQKYIKEFSDRVTRYMSFISKALGARETQALAMVKQILQFYKVIYTQKTTTVSTKNIEGNNNNKNSQQQNTNNQQQNNK